MDVACRIGGKLIFVRQLTYPGRVQTSVSPLFLDEIQGKVFSSHWPSIFCFFSLRNSPYKIKLNWILWLNFGFELPKTENIRKTW